MMQNAHTDRKPRGIITIDWIVVAVAAIAVLFLIGTMIRTSAEGDATPDGVGLRALSADDTLLAFQDFSFDAGHWDPSDVSDDVPGLGPVLGPFGAEAVQRSFTVPTAARAVTIQFDVYLIGNWSGQGHLRIALGQAEALVLSVAETAEVAAAPADIDRLGVQVSHSSITPSAPETAFGGEAESLAAIRVQMSLVSPPETIALRLQAENQGEAQWTLDNLSVVAVGGDAAP